MNALFVFYSACIIAALWPVMVVFVEGEKKFQGHRSDLDLALRVGTPGFLSVAVLVLGFAGDLHYLLSGEHYRWWIFQVAQMGVVRLIALALYIVVSVCALVLYFSGAFRPWDDEDYEAEAWGKQ